jgi:hypothetical protein
MKRWLAIAFFLSTVSVAFAMEDTTENREQQVDRYLQAVPPKAVFDDMMSKMFKGLPADQREAFMGELNGSFNFQALTNIMRGAMLKTFTADELGALADFYGSPIGKSAMSKMGDYMGVLMADLMPLMNAEMAKMSSELDKSQAELKKRLEDQNQQNK